MDDVVPGMKSVRVHVVTNIASELLEAPLLLLHRLYVLVHLIRFHHRSRSRALSLALLLLNSLVQNGYGVALCQILYLPQFRFPLLFRALGMGVSLGGVDSVGHPINRSSSSEFDSATKAGSGTRRHPQPSNCRATV